MIKLLLILAVFAVIGILAASFTKLMLKRDDRMELRRGELRKRNAQQEAERNQLKAEVLRLTALKDEIKADVQNHLAVVENDVIAHRVHDAIRKVE